MDSGSEQHGTVAPRRHREEAHATTLTNETNNRHGADVCCFFTHLLRPATDAYTLTQILCSCHDDDEGNYRGKAKNLSFLSAHDSATFLIKNAGLLSMTRAWALDECVILSPLSFAFLFLLQIPKVHARVCYQYGAPGREKKTEYLQ